MTATLPPAETRDADPAPSRLQRVRSLRPPRVAAPRAPWLLGVAAALWSAVIGLGLAALPVVVVWMASPSSGLSWPEALRIGGLLWLVANGAAITIGGVTYTLLPWGLLIVALILLGYSGGWAARRSGVDSPRGVLVLVLSGTLAYAIVGVVVASVVSQPVSSVSLVRAIPASVLVALVGLSWGAMRASGLAARAATDLPWLAVVLRSGTVAAAAILGAGALAAAASLLVHMDDAVTVMQSLGAGLWGGVGLVLLGIAFVPVAMVWGAAYVLGAGIVIGPAVTVSPFLAITPPTTLPPFPLLAALPQTASVSQWALPLIGVLAGVLAGLVVIRGARREPRLVRALLAAAAAVTAAVLLAVLAHLSSGALGNLRLQELGPSPATVGILTGALVALGAVPLAVVPAAPGSVAGRRARRLAVAPTPDVAAADDEVGPTAEHVEP